MENKYDPLAVWTQFFAVLRKKYVEDIGSILEETKEQQNCLSDLQALADRLGDQTGPRPGLPKTKTVYLAR
jgi:hypothetical protein